ncbi:unnamed protein product [Haemonchus placei]|uniref:glucuronosyltransferase n=1 Tax=Haemonchus placei TaxID=6290 RepID=A0A0N4WL60_HAEPC|nr:unnamed protein product [Haemonchus placei]
MYITLCNAYKVLVINPKMGYSHMNFMGRLADTIAEAGHEVVTLQPVMDGSLASNGTTKSRLIQRGPFADMARPTNSDDMKLVWTSGAKNPIGLVMFVPMISNFAVKTLSHLLDDKPLLEQLKAEQFDVAITELFDFIGIGVLNAVGVKNIIGAHSSVIIEGTALAIGVPVIPSFMPASFSVTDDSTDLWTRATNLVFTGASLYFQKGIASAIDRLLKEKLGSNAIPIWMSKKGRQILLQDTVSNMSWVVDNAEPLLDFERPTLHKVVHVGGLSVHKPKPLNKVFCLLFLCIFLNLILYTIQEWDDILNRRPHTVLISFGSVARSALMPDLMKKTVLDIIKSYPNITFIWKYEEPDDKMFKGIENVIPTKWMPQGDLLADNRLTLFVTHGGVNSMMETATLGKPVITIPLFADQSKNAKLMQKYGFGIIVEKTELLGGNRLHEAIDRVIKDKKYQTSATRISRLLARRPFSPEDKLVKTVELAAEFGNIPELKAAGRNLSFFVYYNIDLIVILSVVFLSVFGLILYIILRVCRLCFSSKKQKKQ